MQWHKLDPTIMDPQKESATKLSYDTLDLGSNDLAKPGITPKNFVEEIKCSLL
jgi:hypothetical protein